MWKKPGNPVACGGEEWRGGNWEQLPSGAFSLEEAPACGRGSSLLPKLAPKVNAPFPFGNVARMNKAW